MCIRQLLLNLIYIKISIKQEETSQCEEIKPAYVGVYTYCLVVGLVAVVAGGQVTYSGDGEVTTFGWV